MRENTTGRVTMSANQLSGKVLNSRRRARATFVFVGAAAAIISPRPLINGGRRADAGAEANDKADPARAANGRGGFSLLAFIGKKARNTHTRGG